MGDIFTEIPVRILKCKTLTLESYNGPPSIQHNHKTNLGEETAVLMFMLSKRHPIYLRVLWKLRGNLNEPIVSGLIV